MFIDVTQGLRVTIGSELTREFSLLRTTKTRTLCTYAALWTFFGDLGASARKLGTYQGLHPPSPSPSVTFIAKKAKENAGA
jgi:hypothetical protein